MYFGNDFYSGICRECANDYLERMRIRYKNEKLAMILTCAAVGVYFSEDEYESMKDKGDIQFGLYIAQLNKKQHKNKNFNTFIVEIINDGGAIRGFEEIRDEKETRWKSADKKNQAYVVQTVGYDCFDDPNYTQDHRKYLFNTLADYLTDDVLEDPHKLQSVISLVKTTLQVDQVDAMINKELKAPIPDYQTIDKLSKTKNVLSGNVQSIANENGISAKASGKSNKKTNALTSIMKEASENGFDDFKVNVVSAKLSASYKEVSHSNSKALIEELNAQSDDYARLLSEQSVFVIELQEKIEALQEESRLLKVENIALQNGGKKK